MKNTIFIFILIMFVIPLTGQQRTEPYEFPVKPGTEEWAKLSTSKQMDEVCLIPEKILKSLTTEALLITCMNYPRIIDFFLIDDMQSGFNFYAKHFNGLAELIKRPDLNKILLQSYIDIDLPQDKISGYDPELSYLQIAFFELLISQETIINQYNKNEKFNLLSEAIKKLEQRLKLGEPLYRQITSALILSRILYSENKQLSQVDNNGNDVFKIFNNTVFVADSSIINRLLINSSC